MTKVIKESISGILSVVLKDKRTGEVFVDTGENAGVEIVDFGYTEYSLTLPSGVFF